MAAYYVKSVLGNFCQGSESVGENKKDFDNIKMHGTTMKKKSKTDMFPQFSVTTYANFAGCEFHERTPYNLVKKKIKNFGEICCLHFLFNDGCNRLL